LSRQPHAKNLCLLDEGFSQAGALHDLTVATLRFDLEVERVWGECEGRTYDDLHNEVSFGELLRIATRADFRRKVLSSTEETLAARKAVGGALAHLRRTAPFLARLGNQIAYAVFQEKSVEGLETWIFDDFEAGLDALANPWKEDAVEREGKRRDALDKASYRHLAAFPAPMARSRYWIWLVLPGVSFHSLCVNKLK
jgi:hypothetical protein